MYTSNRTLVWHEETWNSTFCWKRSIHKYNIFVRVTLYWAKGVRVSRGHINLSSLMTLSYLRHFIQMNCKWGVDTLSVIFVWLFRGTLPLSSYGDAVCRRRLDVVDDRHVPGTLHDSAQVAPTASGRVLTSNQPLPTASEHRPVIGRVLTSNQPLPTASEHRPVIGVIRIQNTESLLSLNSTEICLTTA